MVVLMCGTPVMLVARGFLLVGGVLFVCVDVCFVAGFCTCWLDLFGKLLVLLHLSWRFSV